MAAVLGGNLNARVVRCATFPAVLRRGILLLLPCLMTGAVLVPLARGEGALDSSSTPVADQGSSSKYRSEISAVHPRVPGLTVEVLQFADRLHLVNHTGRTVTVYGYEDEPYARVLANGTAERNSRSPATYLNESFYGDINVPAQADAKAPPRWQVIDRTGQIEWHDHRIHYTSPAVPPQVKDTSKRTLVFPWKIPISVGSVPGAIEGKLFWVPENSSVPIGAIVAGVLIVLGGLALVLFVRRRREAEPPGAEPPGAAGGDPAGTPGGKEAW